MNDTTVGHAGHQAPPAPDKTEIDPVCGMKVAPNPAKSVEHGGRPYYFCSQRCVEKFRSDPAQYLAPKPGPGR